MHRMCEKLHNFIESSYPVKFVQVSVECIQCGLQSSLPDLIDSLDEL